MNEDFDNEEITEEFCTLEDMFERLMEIEEGDARDDEG